MASDTTRYTATLPLVYMEELRKMADAKKIPSVNFAINKALEDYLKNQKAQQYTALMREAGQDEAFLARTLSSNDDFSIVDNEVKGSW